MAQLVLGVAGAAIGSTFGMTAAGWTIGVMLGGLLDPQNTKTEGPRLSDLKVQSSAYGGMKPVIYGSMRTNGNAIFCTNKREVATDTTTSGKGGPTATNTAYSYNVDIAIALCANQIAGIRKIWNNGLLIYDRSSSADISTVIASTTTSKSFKVYLGSEAQLPDPTLEANLGVGNVPGYRGIAYVVFDHMDCPNGQIPQLSFEVTTLAANTPSALELITLPAGTTYADAAPSRDGVYVTTYPGTPTGIFGTAYLVGPGWIAKQAPISYSTPVGVSVWGSGPTPCQSAGSGAGGARFVWSYFTSNYYSDPVYVMASSPQNGQTQRVLYKSVPYSTHNIPEPYKNAYDKLTDQYCGVSDQNYYGCPTNEYTPYVFVPELAQPRLMTGPWPGGYNCGLAFYSGIIYGQYYSGNTLMIKRWSAATGADLGDIYGPTFPLAYTTVQYGSLQVDERGIYMGLCAGNGTGSFFHLLVWKYSGGVWTQLADYGPDSGRYIEMLRHDGGHVWHCEDSWCYLQINSAGSPNRIPLVSFDRQSLIDIPVANIIADVCTRAGLPSAKLDTSGLTDTVTGYALTQVSAARANLLPIQQYGFIDGIESDGLLKWRPRASLSSVATINYDELAAEQDGTAPGDPMPLSRTQEIDLPRSVALNYLNTAADYQGGTETSRRIITGSVNDVVAQLPIATTASRAAAAADVQLYDAWSERNQRTAKVSRKYAFLDAGDVVTVEYPQGVFTAKRITTLNDTGILIELGLVDSDAAIYAPTAQGASPAQAQIGVSVAPPTAMQIMDIPILRDADNNPSLYVALAGYASGWPGAVLYMGADDASLTMRGGVTQGTVVGYADSALGNWSAKIMDQTNSVLVTIGPGILSSATRDAVLDTGANAALIGNEIIGFTTATLVSGTQYRLSGLIRGLRGTENQVGTHAIGDRFVLLQFGGLLRPGFDLSELNQSRQYRPITTGQSINSAASATASNTGVGFKPFSPVNLRRSAASNDITLTWDRRTRSSVTFPANGVDVPLFETVESYSVDVYSNNTFATIVRTIASAMPTITYTSAQQTADGLTPGAVLNVRVYQIGTAGRGFPLQGSI